MTLAKRVYRARRKTTLSGLPRNIQQWFAGERRFTFYAHTHPYAAHLSEYWKAWKSEHRGAIPPPGLDRLIATGRRPRIETSED
jgi:hypothetical protein